MAVPDFQSLMLPVLRALKDGKDTAVGKVRERVVKSEDVTEKDLSEMLPSGRQRTFENRVGWALSYLLRATLVERVRRGVYRVTDEGKRVLADRPDRVDIKYLRGIPAFVKGKKKPSKEPAEPGKTPEEALEDADRELTEALEADVLEPHSQGRAEVLGAGGCGPPDRHGIWRRRCGERAGDWKVGRRGYRWHHQRRQARPRRGLHPSEKVRKPGGRWASAELRRSAGGRERAEGRVRYHRRLHCWRQGLLGQEYEAHRAGQRGRARPADGTARRRRPRPRPAPAPDPDQGD